MPWAPGQSGNPAGYHGSRRWRHREVFEEIKRLGHRDALVTLSTIQHESQDDSLRAAAAALAPYAHPKLQSLPTPRFVENPIEVPVAAREGDRRTYYVYYLGDFDRAGQDAANSLREKLERFADEEGIDLVFKQIAVTEQQIADRDLPTREPKRKSAADKKWPHDFATQSRPTCFAIWSRPTSTLHLPQDKLEVLKAAEE